MSAPLLLPQWVLTLHSAMRPNGTNSLLQLTTRIVHGAELHSHDLSLAARWSSDLHAKMDRLQQTLDVVGTTQNTRALSIKRLALADKALRTWLAKARLVVMLARGSRWSESWTHAGFTNRRTRVPRRLADRIVLARALVSFFARHPEYGVAFAEVTAARGRTIYERVVQSGQIVELAKNDSTHAREQREAAELDLRTTLRQIISELKTRLDASDPCWTDFGVTPKHPRKGGLGCSPLRRAAPIHFVPDSAPHPTSIAAA